MTNVANPSHRPSARTTFAAFEVRGFAALWLSGFIWNGTRWMALFLCAYLVNDRTGSPGLVQLVGATFFAPMFIGGILGGVLADRVDRYLVTVSSLGVLGVVAVGMAVVTGSGLLSTWMIYPFVLAIGIGGVIDFTSRVSLIYDIVGPARSTNAIALESLARSGGNTTGAFVGGAIIAGFGAGATLAAIGVAYAIATVAMLRVPRPPRRVSTAQPSSVAADIKGGFSLLGSVPGIVSLLAVTVIFNLFYFAYIPLIPVFAERLGVDAFLAGMMASAPGFGMMLGTLVMAALSPAHRGKIYVGGCFISFLMLFALGAAPWFWLALVLVFISGFGQAAFATTQAVLTMDIATDETRGRAMGLLSMAIGSLPIGMLALGSVAEAIGPAPAVMGSAVIGAVVLVASVRWRPEAWRMA